MVDGIPNRPKHYLLVYPVSGDLESSKQPPQLQFLVLSAHLLRLRLQLDLSDCLSIKNEVAILQGDYFLCFLLNVCIGRSC